MRFAYFCALLVAGLLMLLVMAVLRVKLMPERVVNGSAFDSLWLEAIKNTTWIRISSSFHSGVEMG